MLFFFLVHVASIIIYLISTALHCTVMIVAMLNWQNFHYTLGKPSKNVNLGLTPHPLFSEKVDNKFLSETRPYLGEFWKI